MHVAITGASGLIGRALTRSLEADGHTVTPVVRPGSKVDGIAWDLDAGTIDAERFEGIDAVVHLAGEGIASGRFTEAHKRAVLESRRTGTDLLARALAGLERPPKVLISGSAIGFYGDRGDEVLTEQSPSGDDFLAEVCRAWEAATAPAEEAGIRVVHVRTGVVLDAKGGALAKQLLPFKLGLGGRVGDGKMWLSWITLDDEVAALRFAIDHDDLRGPVNLTAPNPVTNREFTKALGRALHRPTITVIPGFVRKLPFGIGPLAHALLFTSERVEPRALEEAGFRHAHPDLDGALAAVLGREAAPR